MTQVLAPSPMVSGLRKAAAKVGIWSRIGWLALRCYRNPLRAAAAIRRMLAERARRQPWTTRKYAYAGGRYFWDFYAPGWPSAAFDRFVEGELNRLAPSRRSQPRLQTLIFAITKRCPLRCEHCCEWDALNHAETLSPDAIRDILTRFQTRGVAQVLLSGGEPLQRFDDLIGLLGAASPGTDFWILTSGHALTRERAERLRQAGLTGVALSLDHWNRQAHDRFRGIPTAFDGVERAAAHARRAGLLVALSLCPTREFVSRENLDEYARTARRLGAAFVQILEPKAIGHYAGRDVQLDASQIGLLEEFYLRLNTDSAYREMPAVAYIDRSRRNARCFGAGDRFAYVDTDGDVHPCPFCRAPAGNALADPLEGVMTNLQEHGCRVS
jgi:MoaA/NifB/PqqE/SkfB family radical SAM enzyme